MTLPHFTASDVFLATGAILTIVTLVASLFTDRAVPGYAGLGASLMLVGAIIRGIEWTGFN